VDCNETGFTHENVDAICRIDESTKAKQKATGGSIGEKGIGFKSVFKVADVVWISSGNYSFKFDKHKPLGMIAPIWEDLPSHMKTILGHTTFCLELSGEVTRRHIVDELHALDSRLLIFLHKLRKIKIKIVGQNCKPWESMLVREDGYDLGFNVSTLHQNDTTARYLKFRKRVDSLPLDERRPNISSSDIELAFPISAENKPKLFPQQVFAFLPVRDYGFQVSFQL